MPLRSNTRNKRVRVTLAAYLVLLLSFTGLPLAFGANISFQIVNTKIDISVEDFALCTGTKYEFTQSDLVARGYESCKSQSLTTQNLPASLHVKVRVDLTQNANDWSLHPNQGWDLRLANAKGEVINVKMAGPTAINDKNGNGGFTASSYGIYFMVLELPSSQLIPAGDYVLDASLCDSGCGNGRNPTPRFKLGSFTIQEVANSSTDLMSPKDFLNSMLLISKNAQSNLLAVVKAKATGPCCRYEPLSEYPSPVLFPKDMTASRLKVHEQKVNEWLSFEVSNIDIKRITAETNAVEDDPETLKAEEKCKKDTNPYLQELKNVYSDFSTIQEQYTLEIKNFSPLTNLKNLKQVQNLLLQNQLNSKKLMTEVLTKNNNSSCLIWKSLLADLENHSALYLNLKKSVDQFVVDAEEENITRERIEASRKPTMSEEDLRKKAVVEAARANEKAAAESLIKNNDKAANSKVEQEKIAENELELDGESEDPTGDVSVSYQSSTKKYLVAISSNLGEEDLVLRATKKGAKTLQYKVTTNAEGNVKFSTKNILKGFTMTLLFNGERLDSVKVK